MLSKIRRSTYRVGAVLGHVQAARRPRRIPARVANVVIGRRLVRRLWR